MSSAGTSCGDTASGKEIVPIHPAVMANSHGLQILKSVSLDDWRVIGETLAAISNASAWWIGDWLIYGQDRYPDRYKRAVDRTLLDYQTLRNYSWIARKFEPARRWKTLSFQHHVEVARFRPEEQEHWLRLADRFKWSKNALRKQIKDSSGRSIENPDESGVSVRIDLNANRMQVWERAAERSNHSLQNWIVDTLDTAAKSA